MKEEILKRAMFAMPLSKEARSSGIMSGFDLDEMEADENRDMEEMPAMARTPQNPEILMNNLRGDMRSVDARYQELAQMVGEEAAMETPPEVLAMLQPQLAAQQGGIGALPQGQGMMPPGAQMPAPAQMGGAPMQAPQQPGPAMPQGLASLEAAQNMAPPGAQAPQQYAYGGPVESTMPSSMGMEPSSMDMMSSPVDMMPQAYAHGGSVQHFQAGSGPQGVTASDDEEGGSSTTDLLPYQYAQAMMPIAQARMAQLAMQQPKAVPDLGQTMQARMPIYQQLLGSKDNDYMKTQLLLDIAQRGFGLAANVDEEGRPLRGSFASRLAGAARTLPSKIAAMGAEKAKEEMAIKQLALGQAEKEVAAAQGQNEKLIESQRKLYSDILKSAGKGAGEMFGKGSWEWKVINTPGLMQRYAEGKTTEEEDTNIESAVAKLTKPMTESWNDPYTGNRMTREIPGYQIPFVTQALSARAKLGGKPAPAAAAPATTAPSTGPRAEAQGPAAAGTPAAAPVPATPSAMSPTGDTVFMAAESAIGPVPAFKSFVSRLPIVGGEDESTRLRSFIGKTMMDMTAALQNNPRFSEGERKQIAEEIGQTLRVIDNPGGFRSNLIGLDETLLRRQLDSERIMRNKEIAIEQRKQAEAKAVEIQRLRSSLGVPPRLYSRKDVEALAPGSPFLWQGKTLGFRGQGEAQ